MLPEALAPAREQPYPGPVDEQRQQDSRHQQGGATRIGQFLAVGDGVVYDAVLERGGRALCGRPRRGSGTTRGSGTARGSRAGGIARRGPRSSAGRTGGSRSGACGSSARSSGARRPRSGGRGRRSTVVQNSAECNLGYEIVRLIEGSEGTPSGGADVGAEKTARSDHKDDRHRRSEGELIEADGARDSADDGAIYRYVQGTEFGPLLTGLKFDNG